MGNFCEYNRGTPGGDESQQPSQIASHKYCDFGIYLDTGDILNEEVDVIVAQTDVTLRLPIELTTNQCAATKQQLSRDLQILRDKQAYSHGEVLFSHAAELEFDFVFYCLLPSDSDQPTHLSKKLKNPNNLSKNVAQKYQKQYIYDCTIKCLKLAEELEITSICFPTMHSNNFTISTIAAMQMLAVKNYLEENITQKLKYLNHIRFCISDTKYLEPFNWAFQKVFLDVEDGSDASDDESIRSGPKKQNIYEQELQQTFTKKKNNKQNEDDNFLESFGTSYYDKLDTHSSLERKISI